MNDIENKSELNSKYIDFIKHIENKYIKTLVVQGSKDNQINVGDLVRIGYSIPEGEKERIQYYEGLVIAKGNRGIAKTITLRRNVQGIGIEQNFLLNSPKIISVIKKQSYKVRRAKLYFVRNLIGKSNKLKVKL